MFVKPCLLRAKSQMRKIKIVSVACQQFFQSSYLRVLSPELLRVSATILSVDLTENDVAFYACKFPHR